MCSARFRGVYRTYGTVRSVGSPWRTDMITEIHRQSRGVCGAHRVHAEPVCKGRGILVGHDALGRMTQRAELAAAALPRGAPKSAPA